MPLITKEEQLVKINELISKANQAAASSDFVTKLGGLTLFAGNIDYLAIQVARAMEQAVLRYDLIEKRPLSKQVQDGIPHEDEWFYDNKVSTRKILKISINYLPNITGPHESLKEKIREMCECGETFLNHRITAIHFLGNPRISKEKMEDAVHKAVATHNEFMLKYKSFREEIQPYLFTSSDKQYFFSNDTTK